MGGIDKQAGVGQLARKYLSRLGYGKSAKQIGWLKRQLFGQTEGLLAKSRKHTRYLKGGGKPEETLREATRKFLRQPIKRTRQALGTGPKSMGVGEKALLGGLTAMQVPEAVSKKRGRGERVGGLLGSTAGWLALRRVPMIGNILGYMGGEALGRLGGRAVTRVTGGKQALR